MKSLLYVLSAMAVIGLAFCSAVAGWPCQILDCQACAWPG